MKHSRSLKRQVWSGPLPLDNTVLTTPLGSGIHGPKALVHLAFILWARISKQSENTARCLRH